MSVFNRNKPVKVTVGMRRSWWAPFASEPAAALPVYGDVEDMGAARLGTLTYQTATTDIEGDDMDLRHVEVFDKGTFVAETTLDELELNAKVYGHAWESGVERSNQDDAAPAGGYAFIEPLLLKSGAMVYRATFLVKVTANQANEAQNAATRQGTTINPGYKQVTYTVEACNTGDWRLRQEFPTEAAAEAWLMGLFGATSAYPVSVEIIGSGSVEPAGSTYFTAGTNAVLTFSAAPTVLYDGTVDVTSQVSSKQYTITSIAAPHHLVAIFGS